MFVYHNDPKFTGIVTVGAYSVPFADGRAEVTAPGVLTHLRHAGFTATDQPQVPTGDGEFVDLESLTVKELRDYAADHDIDVTGTARKADLVAAIATMPAVEHESEGVAVASVEAGDSWVPGGDDH